MGAFIKRNKFRIIGLLLLLYICSRINMAELAGHISNVDMKIFSLSLLLASLAVVIKSLRWRLLVNQCLVEPAGYGECISRYYKARFVGAATPGRVGEFIKAAYVRDKGGSLAQGVLTVFADRIFDLLILYLLLIPAIFKYELPGFFSGRKAVFMLTVFILLCSALYIVLRCKIELRRKIADTIRTMGHWPLLLWIKVITLTIIAAIIFLTQRFLLAQALCIDIDFIYLSSIIAMVGIMCLLPVTVQGIGMRDAVLIFFFKQENVLAEKAVALSVLVLATIFFNTCIGYIIGSFNQNKNTKVKRFLP